MRACHIIWSQGTEGNDSIIVGTTRTDRARMLITVLGRLVPNNYNSLHTGKKAEIRPWIGLTNGVYIYNIYNYIYSM